MAKYKKIKMRANNILDFLYQFNDPDTGSPLNDFTIKSTLTHPAYVGNNLSTSTINATTAESTLLNVPPPNGINLVTSPNILENMFDGRYDTCYELAGHSNDGSTYFPGGTMQPCQFTYDFGKSIKPRQIKITTTCSRPFIFQIYFLSDLNNPNLTAVPTPAGFGDPNFVGGAIPYYSNTVVSDGSDLIAGFTLSQNDFSSALPENIFTGPNAPWNYGRDPGLPPLQFGAAGAQLLTDDFGTSVQNLSQHVKGFGGFNHPTRPMDKGFYDGYQFMMIRILGGDNNMPIANNPTVNFGQTSKIVGIEVFEEVIEEDFNVEFDDALLDLKGWRNPRYYGSKLTGKKVNQFTPSNTTNYPDWEGDTTLGKNPVIENKTTALYIANTVVGGKEDEQFATIKGHSYIGINKILLINKEDDTVQILDKEAEGFDEFNRFITKDMPAGGKINAKVIDESISNNLKSEYFVKMNKGYLLKSFNYKFNGQIEPDVDTGINGFGQTAEGNTLNNTMFLYKKVFRGFHLDASTGMATADNANRVGEQFDLFGVEVAPADIEVTSNQTFDEELAFQFAATVTSFGTDDFSFISDPNDLLVNVGPLFTSSSILENKFTTQFHKRRFGFLTDEVISPLTSPALFTNTVYGQTVEFICSSSLNFAKSNDVEMYCTFLEGDKTFSPGINDERSIGTFQIDIQRTLDKLRFSTAEENLPGAGTIPKINEITFKGKRDPRFLPTINPFFAAGRTQYYTFGWIEEADGTYITNPAGQINNLGTDPTGTVIVDEMYPIINSLYGDVNIIGGGGSGFLFEGINVTGSVYLMAGNNGQDYTQNLSQPLTADQDQASGFIKSTFNNEDNFYSGSIETKFGKTGCEAFTYDISFLDKDHTLIVDIDKPTELFDGIGEKGLVILPEFLDIDIRKNVEYYLEKSGIVDSTTSTTSPPTPDL